MIPKEEKGKYINLLHTENLSEFKKWGLELMKKEEERIKKFLNKENNIKKIRISKKEKNGNSKFEL